jgi:hypothetical protein
MQDYEVKLDVHDRMLLDAIIRVMSRTTRSRFVALAARGVRLRRDEHQRQERPRVHHQPEGPKEPVAAPVAACW